MEWRLTSTSLVLENGDLASPSLEIRLIQVFKYVPLHGYLRTISLFTFSFYHHFITKIVYIHLSLFTLSLIHFHLSHLSIPLFSFSSHSSIDIDI